MAKLYGKLTPNSNAGQGKQPEYKGSLKLGGNKGHQADERNRSAALWLERIVKDYKANKEAWISLAVWERTDDDGGSFFSLCLEDSSWQDKAPQPQNNVSAESSGGDAFEL